MNNKHRSSFRAGFALLAILGVSACSTWDKLDRTEKGAVIGTGSGAVLGGAVGGSQGALLGGVGGGVAGGLIGHTTEDKDKDK